MRYRLSTEVVGDALIRTNLVVDVGEIRFEFVAGEGNRLASVAASIVVPPGAITTYFEPDGHRSWRAGMRGSEQANERVLAGLRALESHLAFSADGTVKSFAWDRMEVELIPDSVDESPAVRKVGVRGSRLKWHAGLGDELLRMAAEATQSHQRTEIAKSFWREARREFESDRYIQAYYNFYFVIEGLYAGGKSSEREIIKAFARSKRLAESTALILESIRSRPALSTTLTASLKKKGFRSMSQER
jgi:hypothetical protein